MLVTESNEREGVDQTIKSAPRSVTLGREEDGTDVFSHLFITGFAACTTWTSSFTSCLNDESCDQVTSGPAGESAIGMESNRPAVRSERSSKKGRRFLLVLVGKEEEVDSWRSILCELDGGSGGG